MSVVNFSYLFQRRGAREAMEAASGATDLPAGELGGGDDDIVVDTLEAAGTAAGPGEFVLNPGQLLGLDQAVLQSIDRCRKSFILACVKPLERKP